MDGEVLLFREDERRRSNRGSLKGMVDRGLDAADLDKGQINFSERNKSKIEILRTDVDSAPEVGESFEDTDGFFHRIKIVRRTENTYRCECDVADPDA